MNDKLPKILIIDDDEEIARILSTVLTRDGYETEMAHDGLAGLRLATSQHYEAIITDINMPQLDGVELVGHVKKSLVNANTPILVISGRLTSGVMSRLARFGMVDVIAKPFELKEIRRALHRRLAFPAQKLAYEPFILHAFKESVKDVCTYYGDGSITLEEPFVQRAKVLPGRISALMPLFGRRAHGSLDVSCEPGFVAYLAARLFAGMPGAVDDALYRSMVGELTNQIAGKLKEKLRLKQFFLVLGIPFVLEGQSLAIPPMVASPKIALPMTTPQGKGWVELALADLVEMLPSEDESEAGLFVTSNDAPHT